MVRERTGPAGRAAIVIDPWTQRWAVVASEAVPLLRLADGAKTLQQVAERAMQCGLADYADQEVIRGLLEQLRDAGLVFSTRQHHAVSGHPVYSQTEIQGLHLEITNACNLACLHCYVSSGTKLPNELSTAELRSVIDQLPPFSDRVLAISGGEPAVRKDCMELVEYAVCERGLRVDLFSNAYKFPRKFAERLAAINEVGPGSVRLQVSIEGATAATNDAIRGDGVLAQIDSSMQMFRQLGLSRSLRVFACITSANVREVPAMVELAERWGVGEISFSQWQRQGNAAETPWETIAPTTEEWCRAGEYVLSYSNARLSVSGNFFGDLNNDTRGRFSLDAGLFPKHLYAYNAIPRVSPDGQIFADQFWTEPGWSLGNIRDMSLQEAFETPRFHEQLAAMRDRRNTVGRCRSCPWLDLCECGSPGHTHAEYGDLNHPDLFCEPRMYWFERYAEHQIDLALSNSRPS